MKIVFHKNFDKRYRSLNSKFKAKADKIILKFSENPHDPSLRNHPLKGALTGKRAISVTGDLRIILEEYKNYALVLMLDIGTHNQVY